MGRIAAFTQEQVFEAANKLAADGIEVSPNALRDHLGRGSFSTFMKHIEAWRKAQEDVPATVAFDMPDNVRAAFAQCWQVAAAEASKEIVLVRDKAEMEIRTVTQRTKDALQAIERLEAEAEADATRIEELEGLLACQVAESAQAASTAAAREAALSAAGEQLAQRIQVQDSEVVRVHEEVTDLRNQLIEGRKALDAAGAKEKVLIEDGATAKANVERLNEELKEQRAQIQKVQEELDAAATRERVLIEDGATAKANVDRLTGELASQRAQSVDVIGRLEKSKQALDAQLLSLQKETKDMAAKLGQANGELEALRTRVISQEQMIERFAPAVAQRNPDGRQTSPSNE